MAFAICNDYDADIVGHACSDDCAQDAVDDLTADFGVQFGYEEIPTDVLLRRGRVLCMSCMREIR